MFSLNGEQKNHHSYDAENSQGHIDIDNNAFPQEEETTSGGRIQGRRQSKANLISLAANGAQAGEEEAETGYDINDVKLDWSIVS